MRSRTSGLLRRPGGQGTIVLRRVDPTLELRWLDVAQRLEAGIELANVGSGAHARRRVGGGSVVARLRRGRAAAA